MLCWPHVPTCLLWRGHCKPCRTLSHLSAKVGGLDGPPKKLLVARFDSSKLSAQAQAACQELETVVCHFGMSAVCQALEQSCFGLRWVSFPTLQDHIGPGRAFLLFDGLKLRHFEVLGDALFASFTLEAPWLCHPLVRLLHLLVPNCEEQLVFLLFGLVSRTWFRKWSFVSIRRLTL